jgi:UDP-glucose 4-epimerase
MRVLVTGAFGFVGHAVTRRLALAGHNVVALTSRAGDTAVPMTAAAEVRYGDVRDAEAMRRAVAGMDAVCHLAALTHVRESLGRPDEYQSVNVGGTRTLIDALLSEGQHRSSEVRLLFASTGAVYGVPGSQPISEDTPLSPTNAYGEGKAAAEAEVLAIPSEAAFGAIILRAFNVAGAVDGRGDSDLTRIIPKALAVANGEAPVLQINGDGSAVRDFVHVDDLACAFVLALDHAEPGRRAVFNVGGVGASVAEIVKSSEEVTGRSLDVEHLPPKPEPQLLVADTARIRNTLGWKPARSTLSTIIGDAWFAIQSAARRS